MSRFNRKQDYTPKQLAGLGAAAVFAVAAGIGISHYGDAAPQARMEADYDRRVVPALRDIALSMCGNKDAATHGVLAAKFIYDSNSKDEVRAQLKAKKVDPHHNAIEQAGSEGYLPLEKAQKLADYIIKNNVITMAEPDIHNGTVQAEYIYNGMNGGFLTFYYQPNENDASKSSIAVPQSDAVVELLEKLMQGALTEFGTYKVTKNPQGQWHIDVTPIVMDGPAAPVRLSPRAP